MKKMKSKGKGKLVAVEENLVDKVWGTHRPSRPENPVFIHPDAFTGLQPHHSCTLKLIEGKPFEEKITELRKTLTEKKSSGMVVTMLDEVAWLLNLRGSDIDYNPVFFSYAVVMHDAVTLYINANKVPTEVKEHLRSVKVAPYEQIFGHLKTLGETIDGESSSGKISVGKKCSWALALALGENKVIQGMAAPHDLGGQSLRSV
jgi:Xaa-Pro aminopeptidase